MTDEFLESIPCGIPCQDCPVRDLEVGERIIVDIATKNLKPFEVVGLHGSPSVKAQEFVEETLYFGANEQPRDGQKIRQISDAVLRVTQEKCNNT